MRLPDSGVGGGCRRDLDSLTPPPIVLSESSVELLPCRRVRAEMAMASSAAAGETGEAVSHESVLAAVRADGLSLWDYSTELRGDRDIVLAAVRSHGAALEACSKAFAIQCRASESDAWH